MKKAVLLLTLFAMLVTGSVVAAAPPSQTADGEVYIVQPGDWLTKIARSFYGDADAYHVIVEATNAKAAEDASFAVIDNPSLIKVGQKLWIPAQAQPVAAEGELTLEALQNAVYQGIYDEPVQLTDGKYEGEPFVPGGASRPTVTFHPEVYAFGDLNGDGVDDAAVILIESSGGSGNFRYLAAVINESGIPVNVATLFIGDREQMQAISIDGNEITVDMVAHGPDDPMCCPTQEATKMYRLQDDQLVEVVVGLEGTTWVLVSYGDPSDPQAVLAGSEITAEFDSAEGTVTGSAGCNNYFGSYEVDGETITFGPLGSTLVECSEPEGIMEQELAYLAALGSAVAYHIEGDKLELVDADGTCVAQFVALPPASLAGTEWTLTAYNNGQEAVVSVLIGTEITAAFGEDGRLTGSAGCNTYGASYEVDGDQITFGPAVTTRMWCAEPEGIMDQENAFLAALGSAATCRIQGDKLEMRTADGALALQFTAKPTEPAAGEAYIVQPGDWLTKIARDFYGDADAYRVIVEATNAKAAEDASFAVIDNPSLIGVGQKLWIPAPQVTTEVIAYVPPVPSETQDGHCWTNFLNSPYSWSCMVDSQIFEPCLTAADGETIVCNIDPLDEGKHFALNLTEPLPEPQEARPDVPISGTTWLLELGDGVICGLFGGTSIGFDEKRVNYGCTDDTSILGEPQPGTVWTVEQIEVGHNEDGFFIKKSEIVPVIRAWQPGDPTTAGKGLTLEALKNAEYQGIYDEPVQLTDGRYEGEPFVPGGASRPTVVLHPEVYAFGDLNGDGVDDAVVILIENSGGSGNFLYLAAVINEGGAPVNVATQFIGDREQVKAISIDGSEITVDMVAHGPEDPMCCPTQEVTKRHRLQGDQLVEL